MANESAKFMKNAFIGWTNTHGMYYPPDFDPTKLVSEKRYNREKREKGKQKGPRLMNIRMMMPFSMVCDTCGNFTYVATKFNSRVEKVANEDYYGCAIYRFYGKCQHCLAEFTFKTDPKTADYVMETGGKRNYEVWKDADDAEAVISKSKEQAAEHDAMKALEQASEAAAAEMKINDAIDGQRQINNRLKNPYETIEKALNFLYRKAETVGEDGEPVEHDFEDELESYRLDQEKKKNGTSAIDEDDDDEAIIREAKRIKLESGSSSSSAPTTKLQPPSSIVIKKKMGPPSLPIKVKVKNEGIKTEANTTAVPPVSSEKASVISTGSQSGILETRTGPIAPASTAPPPSTQVGFAGFGAYDSDESE